MNTKELEKCLHLIGYWLNEDETVIDKMLNGKTNVVTDFVEPFSKEINSNLLNKCTVEEKRDLIKYYVFEFFELQGFYKEYYEILFTGLLGNYTSVFYEHTNNDGIVRKLNEFENYAVNSCELFKMLFIEIQICCIKYAIDFFKVCNELNFSSEYIDCGITLGFIEMQIKNLPSQQPENDNKPNGITKPPDFKPKLFKDLFYKPEIIDKCLNLLRETDKPCITEDNKFMRNKGAFIIWFNALEKYKIFKISFKNEKERVKTLNFNFEGLNVSNSLYRQQNVKATKNYKTIFEREINVIKN